MLYFPVLNHPGLVSLIILSTWVNTSVVFCSTSLTTSRFNVLFILGCHHLTSTVLLLAWFVFCLSHHAEKTNSRDCSVWKSQEIRGNIQTAHMASPFKPKLNQHHWDENFPYPHVVCSVSFSANCFGPLCWRVCWVQEASLWLSVLHNNRVEMPEGQRTWVTCSKPWICTHWQNGCYTRHKSQTCVKTAGLPEGNGSLSLWFHL